MKTSGHTVLLTGATSGIGLELAKRLHKLNNEIIAVGRNPAKLQDLERDLPGIKTECCDLDDQDQVRNFIDHCRAKYPRLSVLINNAGIQFVMDWQSEKEFERKLLSEIQVNLTTPLMLTHGLLDILKQQPESAVVNVSSGLAIVPKAASPTYCATKAALHSCTKSLRWQLEGTSVKFFEIMPPLVDTAMTEGRGSSKLTTAQVVDAFVKDWQRDRFESKPGKTRLLAFMSRLAPSVADNIMKKR